MSKLRVAIDGEIVPWKNGGVAHALQALLRALGGLDGDEAYKVVVESGEAADFWGPQLAPNQTLVRRPKKNVPLQPVSGRARVKAALKPAVDHWRDRISRQTAWPEVPLSNGFHESLGCDVLHLTWQRYIICAMPTVYNPHDLQHLHLPQLWNAGEIAWRETMYPMGCRLARTVIVGSQWAREDILREYRVDPDKVQVIPEGPVSQLSPPLAEEARQEVLGRYRLPAQYALYPAIMWPHKNHLQLIEALAVLRDRNGLRVHLVCTGKQLEPTWTRLRSRIAELHLEDQVHSLGFIPEADLRVIQQAAYCLVQPSIFEASSLPIFDAWFDGVPAACARATALPEQVGDAALLFDPGEPGEIAEAMRRLFQEPDLYRTMRERGARRVQDFNWQRTATAYRAVYRRAAHLPLTEEDKWLLAWNWMSEPRKSRNED